jgi:hypothetical protein
MSPGENTKIYELPSSTCWFDDDGILYSRTKNIPRTLENMKESIRLIKEILGNKKVCTIVETTKLQPLNKETREYMQSQLPGIYKAMAVISQSAMGIMVAKISFQLNKPLYPTKMFSNEKEAKEWIKQYL